MSRIRILPENLANQIAAGEVIERPASVVKELLENAIDAGARQVDIQVEGNGTRLIRVVDDGQGMDQDDVLLSLERHATSKIASVDELSAIRSLGFRGEAMPSIASVSRLRITSRPAAEPLGTQVDVRYGRLLKVHEMGGSPGTVVEVSDLFGNVPARKKFLKTAKTELAHIEEVVRNYALCRHDLGFAYTVDGREVLRLPAGLDTPRRRIERLLRKGAGDLVTVGEMLQAGEVSGREPAISGFLLPPETEAAASLRIFVNGRAIHDRMITHAVGEGMQHYLMKGRRPAGVLFLQVSPGSVDVNVHPTKQEVRFHKPNELHQAIVAAVREGMAAYQQALRQDLFRGPAPRVSPQARREESGAKEPYAEKSTGPAPVLGEPAQLFAACPPAPPPAVITTPAPEEPVSPSTMPVMSPEDTAGPAAASESRPPGNVAGGPQPGAEIPAAESVSPSRAAGLRYLGQVLNTYLLCESEDGLLAIDQHAAHERLLFEGLKRQFAARKVARQTLLFPKVIECTLEEAQILRNHAEAIAALGLDLEEFGGDSYVVKAVPAVLGRVPVDEIIAGVFARFAEAGRGQGGVRAEEVLADMACKAAIKAGQSLNDTEVAALLAEMRRAEIFSHCPHGRPVARSFSAADLKKWFYRG
ncbi:DNA mismatch repair endonuclease MutL [Thiovibrio sp. JS02]